MANSPNSFCTRNFFFLCAMHMFNIVFLCFFFHSLITTIVAKLRAYKQKFKKNKMNSYNFCPLVYVVKINLFVRFADTECTRRNHFTMLFCAFYSHLTLILLLSSSLIIVNVATILHHTVLCVPTQM